MSRNLCRTDCRTCDGKVVLCGPQYPNRSIYNDGLLVADAECSACGTKYTAWVGPTDSGYGARQIDQILLDDHGFYDLSYRSTFNDEPGAEDLPGDKVEVFRVVRVGDREMWSRW